MLGAGSAQVPDRNSVTLEAVEPLLQQLPVSSACGDLPLQSMQEPHDGTGRAALALRRGEPAG
jgi:hypothetical protein